LPPQGYRGKTNEPSYLTLIAEAVAMARNTSLREIGRITTLNASQILEQHSSDTE